jgi:ADP-heptose:LPS heptosyltransferase/predicted SAM-dependent methyltransferase
MVWDRSAPYKAESKKIVWDVAPYLKGRGLDVGAGDFKVLPHVISVDNMNHAQFGFSVRPDVMVQTAEDLSVFANGSMDFVYSSHLLEHLEDPEKALKEWWRVVKNKGCLILYLPHEDLYPKMGEEGANPDHKQNLNEDKVIQWMGRAGFWDLEVCEKRNQDDEYSFLMVFRKLERQSRRDKLYFSCRDPKPEKTACVVRYGAYGDLMMAASVWAGLKKQGYHVTVFASPPGSDVITEDPNIDKLVLFDVDQVPNGNLGDFWTVQKKKYDKFVNLCESVEGTFLALPNRSQHLWPPALRHKMMNANYLEFQHDLAGLPHDPQIKFYPTIEERHWAEETRHKMRAELVIMWSLAGSSVHKTWAGLDHVIASIMLNFPKAHVVLVGGPDCKILEAGWEKEDRVHKKSGVWKMRETMAFLEQCDLIIGPETGVLNAASCMNVSKVCLLSHSSYENLTRDWKNTIAIASENTSCPGRGENEAPACHLLQYGWAHCKKDEESGVAQCQKDISVEEVWNHVDWCLQALSAQKKVA